MNRIRCKNFLKCMFYPFAISSILLTASCTAFSQNSKSTSASGLSSATSANTTSYTSTSSYQWFHSVSKAAQQTQVKVIAHRGRDCAAPENTLPAYELAGKLGFWGGETDIQVTSDGVWVVMHDDTVDRMTNGKGEISTLTFAQIKAMTIDAGSNVSSYPGLTIPTFEEYLTTCKRWGIIPITEIKTATYTPRNYDDLLAIIQKYDMENSMAIISFDFDALTAMRHRSPNIMLGILGDITPSNIALAKKYGNAFLDSDYTKVTQALIQQCHAAGVLSTVWTVKDLNTAKQFIGYGVDAITCENIAADAKS